MSYVDLASCWEELRGVESWRLLGEFNRFPPLPLPLFSPLFPSISSRILAPTSLVTAQVSEVET